MIRLLAAVVLSLSVTALDVSHRGASSGVVAIDSAVCTLCAQCAQTCPTGAIAAQTSACLEPRNSVPAPPIE